MIVSMVLQAVYNTMDSAFVSNMASSGEDALNAFPLQILMVAVTLTLGKDGAVYAHRNERYEQPIFKVEAVDTTAAGDTFTGYFLAGLIDGMAVSDILRMSAKASSIAVTRHGAVQSIPYRS